MSQHLPGASLPAPITGPTAWAAFGLVFASSSWSPSIRGSDEIDLDISIAPEFQGWLDGVSTTPYGAQARGFIATRILEIAGALTPPRLRQLHLDKTTDAAAASDRVRTYIKNAVQAELTHRFSLDAWEQAVRAQSSTLSDKAQLSLHRFLGLDQLIAPRLTKKSVNYLFKTIKPVVTRDGVGVNFVQCWRMQDVRRKERSGKPDDLGRGLALRGTEALLQRIASDDGAAGASPESLLEQVEGAVRRLTEQHGAWPLIGLVLPQDRSRHKLMLPRIDDEDLRDLVRRQDALIAQVLEAVPQV